MKITWAGATPIYRGGFASAAEADTWAGHSWDRNTALMLRSGLSCAWACPVELMQVNTCAWCCGAWFAIIGFPHGYLRAFCIIMPLCTVNIFTVLEMGTKDFPLLFYNQSILSFLPENETDLKINLINELNCS